MPAAKNAPPERAAPRQCLLLFSRRSSQLRLFAQRSPPSLAQVRPPPHRREGSRHLPQARQGARAGPSPLPRRVLSAGRSKGVWCIVRHRLVPAVQRQRFLSERWAHCARCPLRAADRQGRGEGDWERAGGRDFTPSLREVERVECGDEGAGQRGVLRRGSLDQPDHLALPGHRPHRASDGEKVAVPDWALGERLTRSYSLLLY